MKPPKPQPSNANPPISAGHDPLFAPARMMNVPAAANQNAVVDRYFGSNLSVRKPQNGFAAKARNDINADSDVACVRVNSPSSPERNGIVCSRITPIPTPPRPKAEDHEVERARP